MNKLKNLILVLYSFYYCETVSGALNGNEEEGCYTPDQQLGQCVEVTKCPQLANTVQHKLSTSEANYLKQSLCGFEGLQPKVCCTFNGLNKFISRPSSGGHYNGRHLLPDTNICGLQQYSMFHGRTHANIKEFPWLVLLQYEKPNGFEFNCGGTLINNRYVLTSAHCIARTPESWNLVKVRLGEYNLNTSRDCFNDPLRGYSEQCADKPIDVRVAEKIIHERYNPDDLTQPNDIALLRLNKDITYTEFIRPICLPKHAGFLNEGNTDGKMAVAGWGLLSEARSHSNVKIKSRIPLKSYSDCASVYNAIHVDLHGQLCTEAQNVCTSDSGGPLMVHNSSATGFNWYIAGVKSFGPTPCGNNNWPDVYTKVINYVDWIVSHIKP